MRGIASYLLVASALVDGSTSFSFPRTIHRRIQNQKNEALPSSLLKLRGGHQNPFTTKGRLPPRRARDPTFSSTLRAGADIAGSNQSVVANEKVEGIVFMALSALSFSLMFLGVKLYSNAPTFTLVFYRSVVQAVLSLAVLLQQQKQDEMPANNDRNDSLGEALLGPSECRSLLVARGTFGSLAVAAFFYAIQNLPLPDAITLQFTTPVFAALLAVPLLGETWGQLDQIGAIVCLGGVLLMTRPSWLFGAASAATTAASSANSILPTTVGLVGAGFAAVAYLFVRKMGTKADANVMVLYYAVISALTAPLGAKCLSGGSWDVIGNPSTRDLVVFAGLGVFGFLGQLWTNIGLTKCESAATATLVTNTQIVFAFLFEVLVLHESLSPWSVAGTLIIVGYMVLAGAVKQRNAAQK